MRRPTSERALRRIVADLAAATPEDAADVIGTLPPAQADRVRALLAEVLGVEATPQPMEIAKAAAGPSLAELSPWLVTRFEAHGDEIDLGMTPLALAALKLAVAEVQPDAELVAPPSPPPPRRSWLGLLTAPRSGRVA